MLWTYQQSWKVGYLDPYSYYAGPHSLSQPRDSLIGVATRLIQCSLARGNGLGVPAVRRERLLEGFPGQLVVFY